METLIAVTAEHRCNARKLAHESLQLGAMLINRALNLALQWDGHPGSYSDTQVALAQNALVCCVGESRESMSEDEKVSLAIHLDAVHSHWQYRSTWK